jgi:hypothetical protein
LRDGVQESVMAQVRHNVTCDTPDGCVASLALLCAIGSPSRAASVVRPRLENAEPLRSSVVTALPVPEMPAPPPVRLDAQCAALEADIAALASNVQHLRSAVPERLRLRAQERQAALRLATATQPRAEGTSGDVQEAALATAGAQPHAMALVPADASAELLDTLDALPGACTRLTSTLGKLQRVVSAVHATRARGSAGDEVAHAVAAVVAGTTVAQAAQLAGDDGLEGVLKEQQSGDLTPPALAAAKVKHMHQAAHVMRYAPY